MQKGRHAAIRNKTQQWTNENKNLVGENNLFIVSTYKLQN